MDKSDWAAKRPPPKPEEEKKRFNSSYEIIVDYSEYSTIQGLIYIFFSYQTVFGQIFWILVVTLMFLLGVYWCYQAYDDWQTNPTLTTVITTAYPVKQIAFPSVTICSYGFSEVNLMAGFFKVLVDYLKENKINVTTTPYQAAIDWDKKANGSLDQYRTGAIYQNFLNSKFPGLTVNDAVEELLDIMTASNPDAQVSSDAALEIGSNSCPSSKSRRKRQAAQSVCNPGYFPDPNNETCFNKLDSANIDEAFSSCGLDSATVMDFYSDAEVANLINVVNKNTSLLNPVAGNPFWIDSAIRPQLVSGGVYPSLVSDQPDALSDQSLCLTASLSSSSSNTLTVSSVDCMSTQTVLCRKPSNVAPPQACDPNASPVTPLDVLVDPSKNAARKKATAKKSNYIKDLFKRLDQVKSYQPLLSSLWYSSMPCFDVKNITAQQDGERSLLKYCEWKGQQVPCAAVFKTVPTDRGMCCSFNAAAADELFTDGPYKDIVTSLQKHNLDNAIGGKTPPASFLKNKEPKSLAGKNKGLVVVLDSHVDQLGDATLDSDYDGFIARVHSKGSFPLMSQDSFEIKAGQVNYVALTATSVYAQDGLSDLDVKARKCKLKTETDNITYFRDYNYFNCLLDCSIKGAREKLLENELVDATCVPWFFPTIADNYTKVCDPWESVKFFEEYNAISDDECQHCLPDCESQIYEPQITAVPFRRCDSYNLGLTRFCTIKKGFNPPKYGHQVLAQYPEDTAFLKDLQDNTRHYKLNDIFTTVNDERADYDAYERDIAMLQVFFKKPTAIRMGTRPSMTWIDYLSVVGGLLGLVLGMGFVSGIELVWLCLRLCFRQLRMTNIIR